jgi:hypothetical protein
LTTLTNGTISVSAVATDAAGNASTAGTTSFILDTVAPVTPTLALGTNVTGGATATEATQGSGVVTVSGESGSTIVVTFTNGSNTVTKTVTGTGSAQAVTLAAGDLTTLTNGTISVSAVATDAAGNASTAGTTSFILDTVAPVTPTLALGTNVTGGATAAEATQGSGVVTVSGESGSTIVVTFTNGSNTVTKTVTGTGSAQAVTLASGDVTTLTNGTISVSAVATDAAGNASSAGTTSFVLDTVVPVAATPIANDLSTSSGSTFTFTVAYSDTSGSGIDSATIGTGNVTVTGPGGSGAVNVTGASWSAGVATYTVTHSGAWNSSTDTGTYTIGIAAGSVKDLAGNAVAANASAKTFNVTNNPAVVSINRAGASLTNATSETFTVTFSQAVTGVAASNFTVVDGSGVTGNTIGTPTTSDGGTTWSVTVSNVAGNGTLGLNLSGIGSIAAVSNSAALGGIHSGDQTYTIDNTPPALTAVSIVSSNATNTVAKTGDTVTVSFTTDGTQTGTPTATIDGHSATVTNTGGNNFTATYAMAGGDASGAVTFAINAVDAVGNTMTPVTADIGSASAVTFDKTAPVAATLVANNLSAPSASTFTFTVAYTDAGGIKASTIGTGNVTVTGPGSMGALTVTGASWNSGTATATYTVQAPHSGVWNSATDVGTYTIGIAAGSVTDVAGNAILASAGAATFTVAFVPTTTVTGASLSADTGTSSTDFLTKTAAQTISGTLSANLVTGEFVQVSYDNGVTWANATTSTVSSNTWSTTTTLAGSSTFEARVSNGGANSTAYTHAYTLDAVAPTISGTAAAQAVSDNATLHPFASLVLADSVSSTEIQTVTVTLDSAAKGTLSNLGGGSYNATTGVYSFSGTAAAATTAIEGLVFTPTTLRVAAGATETTTFTVATTDAAGNTVSNASSTVVSTAINHAPVLTATTTALATTNENTVSTGVTVASLLSSSGYSDVDLSAAKGIAVTAATGMGGWQFSTDGTTWTSFGSVSASSALLLNATTLVRYNPGSQGAENVGITFAAWDQTSGTASGNGAPQTANTASNGGSTAFSTVDGQAQIAVSAVPRPVIPPPAPVVVPPLPPVVVAPVITAPSPVAEAVNAVVVPPPAAAAPIEIAPPVAPAFAAAPPRNATAAAPAPTVTTSLSTAVNTGPTTLVVDHGIDNISVSAGSSMTFTVPKNAFVDSSQNVQLTFKATLADGSPLPNWLHFNPTSGTFSGTPPAGEKGDLHIKVDARDSKGNEASTTFTVKNGTPGGEAPVKPTKPAVPQKQGALSGKGALAALGIGDFGLQQGESAGDAISVAAPDSAAVDHAVAHAPHLSAQLHHQAHRFAHARATTLQHVAAVEEARRIG